MHLCEALQNTHIKRATVQKKGDSCIIQQLRQITQQGNVCKTKKMQQIKCSLGLDLTKFLLSFVLQAKFWHVWSLEVCIFICKYAVPLVLFWSIFWSFFLLFCSKYQVQKFQWGFTLYQRSGKTPIKQMKHDLYSLTLSQRLEMDGISDTSCSAPKL